MPEMHGWWIVLERELEDTRPLPEMYVGPYPSLEASEYALDESLLIEGLCGSTDNPYVTTDVIARDERTTPPTGVEVVLIDPTEHHHDPFTNPETETLMPNTEHTFLVAVSVNGPSRDEAERVLSALLPSPRTNPGVVEEWWIAEDDRRDRSDNDSAVFVSLGNQYDAARLLHEYGLTPSHNVPNPKGGLRG